MNKAASLFNEIIKDEKERLRSSYPSKDVTFPIIEIVRSFDYHTLILKAKGKLDPKDQAILFEKYNFGWSLAFALYYKDLELRDDVPLFTFSPTDRDWVDQIIQHAGALQIGSQLLDYCKADLMAISNESNTFTFEYSSKDSGVEYYERLSIDYYFTLIDGILENKKKGYIDKLPEMRSKLRKIVNVVHEKFITYQATEEFDDFYSRLGYLSLMTSQIVDDFDETDTFGGIAYKKFMDHVEYGFRAALMRRDCCMASLYKSSNRLNLRDILTYAFSVSAFSQSLSDHLGEASDQLREVISCLTVGKNNFEHHLSYPGVSAPPYFQIGSDTLMRSVSGCLDKPVQFLNRELKRKYPADFFNAVNRREARFRGELYDLFPHDHIVKVYDNVIIRSQMGDTDIDAVLFDVDKKTLGLFQLKWQDSFSTSMKERFSRISNLIPKTVEWIDKVASWLQATDTKTVLNTLKVNAGSERISDVYLFVIARHHVHFSDQKLDERAVWASWFQVLESSAKVKGSLKANPIGEFAAKLTFFAPKNRRKRIEKPIDIQIQFSKYKLVTRFARTSA